MNNEGRSRAPPLQNLQSPVVGVGVLDDPFYIDRRDVRRPSPYKFPAKKDGFRRPFSLSKNYAFVSNDRGAGVLEG